MASDTGVPLTFPHCKQRSRLFEAIQPPTIKRPRKGKTSIRKFVFFGKFAKPRGSHRKTRITTELAMPVQDAFEDRKSTRLNSSHTVIYTLSLHDALPISRVCR